MAIKTNRRFRALAIAQNLDEISVNNFYDCLGGDLRKVCHDTLLGPLIYSRKTIARSWDRLYNAWTDRTNTNTDLKKYKIATELIKAKTRYQTVAHLIGALIEGKPDKVLKLYIEELRAWGFHFDLNKDYNKELAKIKKQHRAARNKVSILQADWDEIKEAEDDEKKPLTLVQQKIKLQQALGGVLLDLNNTSVDEWLTYWEQVAELNEQATLKALKNGK